MKNIISQSKTKNWSALFLFEESGRFFLAKKSKAWDGTTNTRGEVVMKKTLPGVGKGRAFPGGMVWVDETEKALLNVLELSPEELDHLYCVLQTWMFSDARRESLRKSATG